MYKLWYWSTRNRCFKAGMHHFVRLLWIVEKFPPQLSIYWSVYSKQMFQGTDAPRAITIQSSEGHCCQAAGALSQHQHDLEQHISQVGFCKEEQKHLMKRSVFVVNRRTNTLRRSRIFSPWWPTQKQIKNCRKIKPSVFFTAMPFSFALSLSFFCRHDYDGASGNSSWHLWKIAVYNLTSYISPICLCV